MTMRAFTSGYDPQNKAGFMDQGSTQGLRNFPGRGKINLSRSADDRGRGWQGRYREAPALAFEGNAFRVVYAVQLGEEIWAVHAFQKKSTQGIKMPKREIDLVKDRLKRLKENLG